MKALETKLKELKFPATKGDVMLVTFLPLPPIFLQVHATVSKMYVGISFSC
jgi:hypothetical protein